MVREEQAVREATRLSAKLIYEVVRRDGEEELDRPFRSLVWSGLAAGILISLSVLGEAVLRLHLPDVPGRFLIENLGYSLGFLMVILGRMQLFTENTITTILPLAADRTRAMLLSVLRLWLIVLIANVAGALIAASFLAHTSAIGPELRATLAELSAHATGFGPSESFLRAIPAGILVAGIVWMMPGGQSNEFFIIVTFTWLIATGDFTHVIAGSVEMWFLVVQGTLGALDGVVGFLLPVFAGNVVGGTAIFALLAWGQVKDEVDPDA